MARKGANRTVGLAMRLQGEEREERKRKPAANAAGFFIGMSGKGAWPTAGGCEVRPTFDPGFTVVSQVLHMLR